MPWDARSGIVVALHFNMSRSGCLAGKMAVLCLMLFALRAWPQGVVADVLSTRTRQVFVAPSCVFCSQVVHPAMNRRCLGPCHWEGETKLQATRGTSDWMAVDDIQHTYAAKDFEQQVVARLATQADHGIERLTTYTISGDNVTKQADLQQQFPSSWVSPKPFPWKFFKQMKGSSPDPMVVECDLYLRGTDLKPNDLFKDCAQCIVQLAGTTPWEQIRTTADLPIILAEVAETPASLQAKLWQLERALTFGPDLQQAACCVVCLNADMNSFRAASTAARRSLNSSNATFKLAHFDVFAIWTQYRNVYAEIRNVKDDVREVKTLLEQLIQKLEQ
eukprot:CAMPEP_0181406796 /NCGR_PEP_ID=MMETSP1110-20121109/5454_1 /TAXON_ID=174948 /ORGANISM="Symbiodinium sp., Strain CCMP421" /LENGTH=332 /DNA_ID=CAMNT_0023529215 /DNA_START=82 /DNA_END=1080 /DNA_ORIENTATION=+